MGIGKLSQYYNELFQQKLQYEPPKVLSSRFSSIFFSTPILGCKNFPQINHSNTRWRDSSWLRHLNKDILNSNHPVEIEFEGNVKAKKIFRREERIARLTELQLPLGRRCIKDLLSLIEILKENLKIYYKESTYIAFNAKVNNTPCRLEVYNRKNEKESKDIFIVFQKKISSCYIDRGSYKEVYHTWTLTKAPKHMAYLHIDTSTNSSILSNKTERSCETFEKGSENSPKTFSQESENSTFSQESGNSFEMNTRESKIASQLVGSEANLLNLFRSSNQVSKIFKGVFFQNGDQIEEVIIMKHYPFTLVKLLAAIKDNPKLLCDRRKINLAIDLVSALDTLHETNCIHRDLKPANIFVSKKYKIALGDFGLAHDIYLKGKDAIVRGSHEYIPFELIKSVLDLKEKEKYMENWSPQRAKAIDIFSLGTILWQIFSNKYLPWQNSSFNNLNDYFHDALKEMEKLHKKNTPDTEIKALLLKMLHLDPDKRPITREILKELEAIRIKTRKGTYSLATQFKSNEANLMRNSLVNTMILA